MASGSNNNRTHNTSGSANGRSKQTRSGDNINRSTQSKAVRKADGQTGMIIFIVFLVAMVILFLCNFHLIGVVGEALSGVMFGIFGGLAFVVPLLAAFGAIYYRIMSRRGLAREASKNIWICIGLALLVSIIFDLSSNTAVGMDSYNFGTLFSEGKEGRCGGGLIAGSLAYLIKMALGKVGLIILLILGFAICIILLAGTKIYEMVTNYNEEADLKRRERQVLREDREELRARERQERIAIEQERIAALEERRKRVHIGAANQELLPDNNAQTEVQYENEPEAFEYVEPRQSLKERSKNTPTLAEMFKQSKDKNAEKKRLKQEQRENDEILKKEPVSNQQRIREMMKQENSEEIHEITAEAYYEEPAAFEPAPIKDFEEIKPEHEYKGIITTQAGVDAVPQTPKFEFEKQPIRSEHSVNITEDYEPLIQEDYSDYDDSQDVVKEAKRVTAIAPETPQNKVPKLFDDSNQVNRGHVISGGSAPVNSAPVNSASANSVPANNAPVKTNPNKKYRFPSLDLLNKGKGIGKADDFALQNIAQNLADTLASFGVNVTINDYVKGPAVTRFEMSLDPGTKVSKILNLADDIKYSLASADIRIEAPIPGKSAVGIEVPNDSIDTICLRDLLETGTFKEAKSNLSFAVGKNIGGDVIVTDIAKMPHVLIAGATGSGKSVCINTLIMSLIYKSSPEDVQMIMVDPKVVELSVYNGIPHLMLPVVTDPKKAANALKWGVVEMENRYRKFAEMNVRDLAGYNEKIKGIEDDHHFKLPQIVIIIDELADLMMVCGKEVEEAICRLAQLARACGIHLVVATQRPSVDVITGLIKANMPSRMAFAVSSGIDSRTILDTVGAEKLLGKGDMLFYPQGKPKPERVQGAFVSDDEVSRVVEFLVEQRLHNDFAEKSGITSDSLESSGDNGSTGNSGAASGTDDGRDELFAEAGRCIISSGKASIGYLQRMLKIGFNRAARIMDNLADEGVVSADNGTKAREILMTMEEFESYLSNS